MRSDGIPLFAAAFLLIVAIAPALAQEHPQPPSAPAEQPAKPPDHDSSGTSPDGMGSTGWTGGSRGQSKPEVGSRGLTGGKAHEDAADQTLMATGVDLNGPPTRFPAWETPE
jgi:hypothetical protein